MTECKICHQEIKFDFTQYESRDIVQTILLSLLISEIHMLRHAIEGKTS